MITQMLPPGCETFSFKRKLCTQHFPTKKGFFFFTACCSHRVHMKTTDGDAKKKTQKQRDGSWKTDFSGEKSLLLYLLCCWWCGPKVVGIDKSAAVHQQKSPAPSRTRRPGSARTSRRTRHRSHKQRLEDIIKGETRTWFPLDSVQRPSYGSRLRPPRGDSAG